MTDGQFEEMTDKKPEKPAKKVRKPRRRSGTQRNLLDTLDEILAAIGKVTMDELSSIAGDKALVGKLRLLKTTLDRLAQNASISLNDK
jgi:hypothetical protein